MRVLVLGSGAKDHAIAWWFSQSRLISALYVAPGNAGTESIAKNLAIDPSDPEAVYQVCQEHQISYVFIGTEAPLFTGVIDYLNERGIDTFGAPKRALPLEGDRDFARNFTERHKIPTPRHALFTNTDDLSTYLKDHEGERFVVKSNQIAPSRVMVDSSEYQTLMDFAASLLEKGPIILEQHLVGTPMTITLFLDTNSYLMLPICSDYMRVESGGTPTGGMGSICPVPLQEKVRQTLIKTIVQPTLEGLKKEGMAYKGVLTISTILTQKGPMLVDYHVRFNDPAAQAFIPLICTDLVEILTAMQHDTLGSLKLCCSDNSSVALVIASEGYPQHPVIGKILDPIPAALLHNTFEGAPKYFFGGVQSQDGKLVTTGGRNVTVVGVDYNIMSANKRAYQGVPYVKFENAWYRQDIGNKFFEN
ncbi:MAG: phosphoribosylamine--glycine ligase [Sphaerochaeta sp.]